MISVHVEVTAHLHRTVTEIRRSGCRPGVAVNPATPLVDVEEILPFVDYVLVMSVNPGFGGQSFIGSSLDKISRLRDMIDRAGLNVAIEVDGGIDSHNVGDVVRSGASLIVAGTAVFGRGRAEEDTRALRERALEPLAV